MLKMMLETNIYHMKKTQEQLRQIKHISEERLVKDEIKQVMKDLGDLITGTDIELSKIEEEMK